MRTAWRSWPVLLFVLGAGAVLRLYALGFEGLWCDEAYTAETVRLPWMEMFTFLVRHDDAPPLFYALQKFITWFGDGEAMLRALPALSGIAAVMVLLARARRDDDPRAFWTGVVFAVSALPLFYARQVRSYGLLMLLVLLVVLAARDLLFTGRRKHGIILAVAGALLCLTHNVGAVLLASSLPLWLLHPRGPVSLPRWLGWHAIPLAACAAWWAFSWTQLGQHAELNPWMGGYWEENSLLAAPWHTVRAFVPGLLHGASARQSIPVWIHTGTLLPMLSGIIALAVAGAAFSGRGKDGNEQGEKSPDGGLRGALFEAGMFLIPLLALMIATRLWAPVYVVGRTDLVAYPAFILLLGRGLARMPWRVAVAAAFLWCGLSVATLLPSYGLAHTDQAKGKDRRIASFLAQRPGIDEDWLIHGILTGPSLNYYLRRSGATPRSNWFPEVAGRNPAAVPAIPPGSRDAMLREAQALKGRLEAAVPSGGSVWIVGILNDGADPGKALTYKQIAYPTNVLVHTLVGRRPIVPERIYRQDWMAGRRVLFRIPRDRWLPPGEPDPS